MLALAALVLALAGCGSTSHPKTAASSPVARPPTPPAAVTGALVAEIKKVRSCLAKQGLHVSGGPVFPEESPTSPDGELVVGRGSGGAFVAFYTDASRAAQLEPQVTASAGRVGGQVERRGAVTVLLIHHPPGGLRHVVLTCAFS